jgi:hypothetical protein
MHISSASGQKWIFDRTPVAGNTDKFGDFLAPDPGYARARRFRIQCTSRRATSYEPPVRARSLWVAGEVVDIIREHDGTKQ